jgi:Uma2 family endonuclease
MEIVEIRGPMVELDSLSQQSQPHSTNQSTNQKVQLNDPESWYLAVDVTWAEYEAVLAELGDSTSYRVNYLDGDLEIVAPSRRHESGKTRIGNLLEIYFIETDTEYFPTGSTTFRNQEQQAGAEPDESYCIGIDKPFPDLAIEVVVTSGNINRLERFRRLGVREVWFLKKHLAIYHLREDAKQFAETRGYEAIARSELLPDLDVELLSECLQNPNPLAAAKAFRQGLQKG